MDKKQQFHAWYFLVAFLGLMLFQSWWSGVVTTERIPYSQFLDLLERGQIASVQVTDEQLSGRYVEPQGGYTGFVTNVVPEDLSARLAERGVEFDGTVTNTFIGALLSWLLPMVLIFGLWFFVFRSIANRQGFGGVMSVGKSRAKVYVETDTGVTFDDVAGSRKPRPS
jgi:cell division protease FtsH